jgi:hypothetical protein
MWMEHLGTAMCDFELAEDGALILTPHPGDVLDSLRGFRSPNDTGRCVAAWGSLQGSSGTVYNPLTLVLGEGEASATVVLIMPQNLRDVIPAGVVRCELVLSEVADPTDSAISAAQVLRFDVPPLT